MLDLQKLKEEITCIAVNSFNEYLEALCYGIDCNIEELKKEAEENIRLQSLANFLITNPSCEINNKVICSIENKIKKSKTKYNCNLEECSDVYIINCNTIIEDVLIQTVPCAMINIKVIR